jgi:adenosine deaminase
VLKSFQDDGVVYLELRTTPRAIPTSSLTKDGYVGLVLSCISSFSSAQMTTKLVLAIDRRNTAAEAEAVVDLALKHRAHGVVGVDLCGNLSVGDVFQFGAAFARARAAGLGITPHFAETPHASSDEELRALLDLQPHRLGHVIHVATPWKEIIRERRIALELCLSCNAHAKMIAGGFADHHFRDWWDGGDGSECLVVLCVHANSLSSPLLSSPNYPQLRTSIA